MSHLADDVAVYESVRGLIGELGGVAPAARALELSRSSTAAIAAGLKVHRGTMALARVKLAEREGLSRG